MVKKKKIKVKPIPISKMNKQNFENEKKKNPENVN